MLIRSRLELGRFIIIPKRVGQKWNVGMKLVNPFQPNVAFYIETSHLIWSANMTCNNELKRINMILKEIMMNNDDESYGISTRSWWTMMMKAMEYQRDNDEQWWWKLWNIKLTNVTWGPFRTNLPLLSTKWSTSFSTSCRRSSISSS